MKISYYDPCGNCKHELGSHTYNAPYDINNNIDYEIILNYPFEGGSTNNSCRRCLFSNNPLCFEFKLNNLRLLEYRYEESTKHQEDSVKA